MLSTQPSLTHLRRKHGCGTCVFGSSRARNLQFDPKADLYSLCCCFSDVSWRRSLATMPMMACRMAPPYYATTHLCLAAALKLPNSIPCRCGRWRRAPQWYRLK